MYSNHHFLSLATGKMWANFIFMLVMILMSNQYASAQAVAEPDKALKSTATETLTQLVNLAIERNPTAQQASAEISKTQGQRYQATRYPNPNLFYQGNEIGNAGSKGQHGLYVGQEFVTADKLSLTNQSLGWEVEQARAKHQAQLYRIAGGVRLAYYDWLAAQQRQATQKTLVDFSKQALSSAEKLFMVGDIPQRQLLQVQIMQEQNQLVFENLLIEVATSRKQLLNVSNLDNYPLPEIYDGLSGEMPHIDPELMWQQILAKSPEVTQAQTMVWRHQWAVQRERVQPIPNLQTQMGVQYDDNTKDTFALVTMGVEIPKFNNNAGNISRASAEYLQATRETERVKLDLYQRFNTVSQQYQIGLQKVARLEKDILPVALNNVKINIKAFQAGEANYLELLTSQEAYINSLHSLVEARRDVWKSASTMESVLLVDGLSALK